MMSSFFKALLSSITIIVNIITLNTDIFLFFKLYLFVIFL